MTYENASNLGRMRAMARHFQYLPQSLSHPLFGKWCTGTLTEADAAAIVPSWEKAFADELGDWKQVLAVQYQHELSNDPGLALNDDIPY